MSKELEIFLKEEQISERLFKEYPQTLTFEVFVELMDKFKQYKTELEA